MYDKLTGWTKVSNNELPSILKHYTTVIQDISPCLEAIMGVREMVEGVT